MRKFKSTKSGRKSIKKERRQDAFNDKNASPNRSNISELTAGAGAVTGAGVVDG